MELGKAIQERAIQLNMSIKEVRDKVDISQPTFDKILKHNNSPTMDSVKRIAKVLELPVFMLILMATEEEEYCVEKSMQFYEDITNIKKHYERT